MKIDRMLTIIVMLLNRSRISAGELAEKFEVSVRTVYRDIETINMAGIPIISYPGKNGGFGIIENYKLNNQFLSLRNLCSMLSALNGVNASLEDAEIEESIEKLRSLVPQDKIHHLEMRMEQVIVTMQPWAYNPKQKSLIKKIQNAIVQSQLITVTYRSYANEPSTRQIEAMSLIFKSYTWYLFAYCRLRGDFRLFRVSRIVDFQVDDGHFTPREKSYQEMEEEAMRQASFVTVTLKFSPRVRTRVEDIFARERIAFLSTGEMIVTAQFPKKDWNFSLILSFGEHVEVIGPEYFRREIAGRINSMNEKYRNNNPF